MPLLESSPPREALRAQARIVFNLRLSFARSTTSASRSRKARCSVSSASLGSGKSTTGRCILRLVEPSSGDVLFREENVLQFSRQRMRLARRDMQIVFQDPYSSLNPRMKVGDIVEEPLVIHKLGTRARDDDGSRSCSSWSAWSQRISPAIRTSSAAVSGSASASLARWHSIRR
jgi:ABC-type phosphate transport system ATPase subunit